MSLIIESGIGLFFTYQLKTVSADDAAVDNGTHATFTAQQILSQLQFLQSVQTVGVANVLHIGRQSSTPLPINQETEKPKEQATIGHQFKSTTDKIKATTAFCKE